jgi:hypothetical protein
MQICGHWSKNLPGLHVELMSPWLQFETLKLLNFDINADLDQDFRSIADPDLAFLHHADPDSLDEKQDRYF